MSGETNLSILISSMQPVLQDEDYVFVCVTQPKDIAVSDLEPLGTFTEAEGQTLIVRQMVADLHQLSYSGVFKQITLNVHSSLEAVGLTAFVSSQLAQQGISANVVAAFFHDHVFVPSANADRALACLKEAIYASSV